MSVHNVGYHKCTDSFAESDLVHAPIPFPPSHNVSTPLKPHIIAAFHGPDSDISTISAPNFVLDPVSPAMEPSPREYINSLFGRRFGIPCYDNPTVTARRLLNNELLQCYSVPEEYTFPVLNEDRFTTWFDDHMRYAIPIQSLTVLLSYLVDLCEFNENLVYSSDHTNCHQVYNIAASPTSVDWKAAYMTDKSTAAMLVALLKNDKHVWLNQI